MTGIPPLSPDENAKRNQLQREKPKVYEKILRFDEKVERGESIAILQFQYDYACNFRCQHCCITRLQEKGQDRKLRSFGIPEVRELARQADELGLAQVVITGGEPLVFPDFDQIVEALDPSRFYITSDTNGWFLDEARAKHLKAIGVDKIQLSLDSLNAEEHDAFRRKPGSHARALRAIDAAQAAGLNLLIATVVTKQRIRSEEFIEFLEFGKARKVPIFVTYAKPVGAWEGNYDVMITREDMDYLRQLEQRYQVFTHLTPAYGMDLGCIAVKRMVSVTKFGDVMPCPYIHTSLGNFFQEPLKEILERGMKLKCFSGHVDTCLIAEDRHFIEEVEAKKIYGKPLPVPWDQVFGPEDFSDGQPSPVPGE
ncbi:radical SAM protein [Holophaga foetida]|uniref:radical SAM protein n=1 Tax=Holophaga foetida TaxID=35839 RepID=UPI00024749F2|nr:radical SAM protein [Holophaga foetida]